MIDPNRIFSVRDDEEFDRLALEVFRFQAEACALDSLAAEEAVAL